MENENVNGSSSGNPEDITGKASGGQNEGEVSYSTYKKTLTQLKNLQEKYKEKDERLSAYETREKQIEQQRLEEQGEYKKLLDLERQKLSQYENEKNEYKNKLITAHKLNAFTEKLPSKIARPEYYKHVDIDSIVIDPESGLVDESSVDSAVNSFMQNHYHLLDSKKNPLPSDAPSGGAKLNYEQWLKLPLKERRARMNEVYNNDG